MVKTLRTLERDTNRLKGTWEFWVFMIVNTVIIYKYKDFILYFNSHKKGYEKKKRSLLYYRKG